MILQHCSIFALLLFSSFSENTTAESSTCGDWISFKDEKCFKILDDTTRTFDEAVKGCNKLEIDSILPVIHSQEEQEFLSDYLFKVQKKVDNFWIGAKYVIDKFHWVDNTDIGYSNWDSRGPRSKENYCVQIQADESFVGKWIGDPCEKKNLVVCQKMQSWSTVRLQKTLLDARKELRDALDAANKKIVQLEKNQVPIGFIYPQLPSEKSPAEIWPLMNWTDVSTTYAGVFFRVNGGDAAAFGQVQEADEPRLDEFYVGDASHLKSASILSFNNNITIPKSGWSNGLFTGTNNTNSGTDAYAYFKYSTKENRPRNMAIRLWKRIS